jgi:transcriptional regulator with XRE-family HTH domain
LGVAISKIDVVSRAYVRFLLNFSHCWPVVTPDSADRPIDNLPSATLADRIRIAKLKGGFRNDVDFAKAVGVARSSMSSYLNGKQTPKPSTLHLIAKIGHVDLNWLLGTAASMPPEPPPASAETSALTAEMLDAPANFYLLILAVSACQEFHQNRERPTLREALNWIAGPYALHASISERKIKIMPMVESV